MARQFNTQSRASARQKEMVQIMQTVANSGTIPEGCAETGRETESVPRVPERGQSRARRAPTETRQVCVGWEYTVTQQDVFTTFTEPDGYANLISGTPVWDRAAGKTVMVLLWSRPLMGTE